MSTTDSVNECEILEGDFTETLAPEQNPELAAQLEAAYTMTPAQFVSLKAADRELALFLLLRELAATVNGLEGRLNLLEDKARVLASPEGMQQVLSMFLGGGMGNGGGMGKMLAGMIGK